jgi:fructokinase
VLTILSFLGWDSFPVARLNGDVASIRVKDDFRRWGVHLTYAECAPLSNTPIIVQQIKKRKDGEPSHRFSWICPNCGTWLPSFRAVSASGAKEICIDLPSTDVFFMDRLSRSAVTLARHAASKGAVIVFEPSGKPEQALLREALSFVHIVKYSDQRLDGLARSEADIVGLLEIQTLGRDGLQYRSRLPNTRTRGWRHLNAFTPPMLVDTCGAGDWCTAGLIAKLGREGFAGFKTTTAEKLQEAFSYGQALAAWNCSFEGARGGMYSTDRASFDREIDRILNGSAGQSTFLPSRIDNVIALSQVCPACPTMKDRKHVKAVGR